MRAPLKFKTHFLWLAGAVLLLAALDLAILLPEPYLPSLAMYGAVHALTCILAMPGARRSPVRKILFVGCAAALNVAVLYAGIICLEALGNVLAALRLYLALAICALFGAIARARRAASANDCTTDWISSTVIFVAGKPLIGSARLLELQATQRRRGARPQRLLVFRNPIRPLGQVHSRLRSSPTRRVER